MRGLTTMLNIIGISLVIALVPVNASHAGFSISFNSTNHHPRYPRYSRYPRYNRPYQQISPYYYNRYGRGSLPDSATTHRRHKKHFSHRNRQSRQYRTCEEVIVRSRFGRTHVIERNCYFRPYKRHTHSTAKRH